MDTGEEDSEANSAAHREPCEGRESATEEGAQCCEHWLFHACPRVGRERLDDKEHSSGNRSLVERDVGLRRPRFGADDVVRVEARQRRRDLSLLLLVERRRIERRWLARKLASRGLGVLSGCGLRLRLGLRQRDLIGELRRRVPTRVARGVRGVPARLRKEQVLDRAR